MFEISRHPQYTSFPLLFAAIALLSDSVWVYVAGLATFLYLHIGLIPVEEAVLRAAHDWMHEEYVRTVPMYTHCESRTQAAANSLPGCVVAGSCAGEAG